MQENECVAVSEVPWSWARHTKGHVISAGACRQQSGQRSGDGGWKKTGLEASKPWDSPKSED